MLFARGMRVVYVLITREKSPRKQHVPDALISARFWPSWLAIFLESRQLRTWREQNIEYVSGGGGLTQFPRKQHSASDAENTQAARYFRKRVSVDSFQRNVERFAIRKFAWT